MRTQLSRYLASYLSTKERKQIQFPKLRPLFRMLHNGQSRKLVSRPTRNKVGLMFARQLVMILQFILTHTCTIQLMQFH